MNHTSITRRTLLAAGAGVAGAGLGAGALSACTSGTSTGGTSPGKPAPADAADSRAALVGPDGPQVAAAEAARAGHGRTTRTTLTAVAGTADLGAGVRVRTWTFAGRLPGREIRLTAGDTLAARVVNHLPAPTAIHWHGLALRNDMDGVPPLTQRAIAPGSSYDYRFVAAHPGTYWFHPHVGVQVDRGLYGPLIVEDPHEPLGYDDEWTVVLDDWLDGVGGRTPDTVYAGLAKGMPRMGGSSPTPGASTMPGMNGSSMSGMSGMDGMDGMDGSGSGANTSMPGMGGGTSSLLGGDAGDVSYPYHLVNGRVAADPEVRAARPGRRLRIRLVNAGGDTAYRVAVGGHRLTLTHTDGFPVEHTTVDAVLLGPGERYDVLVTLKSGVFPLTALAEGKNAVGRALLRTGPGRAPAPGARPAELDGMLMTATRLRAAGSALLRPRRPDRTHRMELTGGMGAYNWSLNGVRMDMDRPAAAVPYRVRQGERVRIVFANKTSMWHPMHLHGHTFQLGAAGPRKDTVIVLPGETVVCDFDADNPGQWLAHCHNAYHAMAGMAALVGYLA